VVYKAAFKYLYRCPAEIFHCATDQCRSTKRAEVNERRNRKGQRTGQRRDWRTLRLLLPPCRL